MRALDPRGWMVGAMAIVGAVACGGNGTVPGGGDASCGGHCADAVASASSSSSGSRASNATSKTSGTAPQGSSGPTTGTLTSGASTGSRQSGSSAPATLAQKVDLLFDVDNSASMGDKQTYLIQAIPQLVARLVTPNCVDAGGTPTGTVVDPTTGKCPSGSTPEFLPVHDMHIGVVTSSLGSRLGVEEAGSGGSSPVYLCDPTQTVTSAAGTTVSAYNDDQGHLVARTGAFGSGPVPGEAALPEGGGFLNWFPALGNDGGSAVTPPKAITKVGSAGMAGSLVGDFTEIVGGVGESGCGIESQLESWYRFLVQPDPYATLVLGGTNKNQATWSGVDTTLLQQRHDFLRPDSVVAVVVLTDENDSEIDVRSFQGTGYQFLSNTYSPPRATSPCFSDPSSPACKSCASCGSDTVCSSDPNCTTNGGLYSASHDNNDWGYNLNLRHVHMPQKYALTAQYPLTRYFNGLTSNEVPNRLGEYPSPTSAYTGANNCTNPLFAASLFDPSATPITDAAAVTPTEVNTTLCMQPRGASRSPSEVYFAHIGGVPHELLQSVPGDGTCPSGTAAADCPQKGTLAPADWVRILGAGPAAYSGTGGAVRYDYTGIDPHMVESETPRNVVSLTNPAVTTSPAESTLAGPGLVGSASDPVRPDPINGREWTTTAGIHSLSVDREYACIFQLPAANQRDCAAFPASSIEENSCDCVPQWNFSTGAPSATGNTPDEIPPLCSKTSTDGTITSQVADYTVQTYAKAYPTVRELMLVNMMGTQGVVSSLCPIHTEDNTAGDDPLYGYRPAMDTLVSRLKSALAH